MQIDEPDTPYHHSPPVSDECSDESDHALPPATAQERLEELERKRAFEAKRRHHYQVQGGALLKHMRSDQALAPRGDHGEAPQ